MRAAVVSLALAGAPVLAGAALCGTLWGAVGCGSPGGSSGPGGAVTLADTRSVFLGDGHAMHARCLAYEMDPVPPTFAAFEAEIRAWVATCVMSRTRGAHREVALVDGNPAVAALWRAALPGGRLRIVPHYVWSADGPGAGRVERILLWSPDVPGSRPPGVAEPGPGPGADPGAGGGPGVPPGPPGSAGDAPPDERTIHDPPLRPPDDLNDIADEARKLLDLLRRIGADDDARRLAAVLERLRPLAVDVALLVGGYYFASKLRAGRLLFLWGWRAFGPAFRRRLARLDRLLPRFERAAGDLAREVRVIKSRHPQLAGSGLDWEVLEQVVDPSVPAQLDGAACGPACVQMVLADRGIHVPQLQLIEEARGLIPELKTKRTKPPDLTALLRHYDPGGGWTHEWDDVHQRSRNGLELFRALGRRSSFIVEFEGHFMVVDGVDSTGHVLIRDPWYEPGRQRGMQAGTRYRVPLLAFNGKAIAPVYRP